MVGHFFSFTLFIFFNSILETEAENAPDLLDETLCYSFTVFMLVWDYLAKGAVNLIIVISTLSMNKLYEKEVRVTEDLYT